MVQQRRPGEVAIRRFEIVLACTKLGVRREQRSEFRDIAGDDRVDRVVELRVRREPGDTSFRLDVMLERRPALEAVLASDDQLRVGELE